VKTMQDSPKIPITVSDLIEHLKTLPQNMEVWDFWDESGEYWPCEKMPVRIDLINSCLSDKKGYFSKGNWRISYDGTGKKVCVLCENFLDRSKPL
jgi:hypothetical protein